MLRNIVGLLTVALMCVCGVAAATPIVYNVYVSDGTETVSGTITTDGFIGPLVAGDITAWSLTAAGPVPFSSIDSSQSGAAVACFPAGCGLTASATNLIFDDTILTFIDFTSNFPILGFRVSFGAGGVQEVITVNRLIVAAYDIVERPGTVIGTAAVPEPATGTLLVLALACLGLARKQARGRQCAAG